MYSLNSQSSPHFQGVFQELPLDPHRLCLNRLQKCCSQSLWLFCSPAPLFQQMNWLDENNKTPVSAGGGACGWRFAGRWNIWKGCIQWSSSQRGRVTALWLEPCGPAPGSETCSRSWQSRRGSMQWGNLNLSSQPSKISIAEGGKRGEEKGRKREIVQN